MVRPLTITRDLQLALAIYTIGVERSRRAYWADMAAVDAPPKPVRQRGMAVGICDRCGIDSTQLTREKCPPCKNYLWRRANRIGRVRQCPACERSHTEPGRTCAACRQRAYRERKKS